MQSGDTWIPYVLRNTAMLHGEDNEIVAAPKVVNILETASLFQTCSDLFYMVFESMLWTAGWLTVLRQAHLQAMKRKLREEE